MTTRPGDDLLDLTVAADRHDLTLTQAPRPAPVGYGYGRRDRLVTFTARCSCWCWEASGTVNVAAPAYDPADMPLRLTTLHTDHLEQAEAVR